ncbi:hypothetical protein F5H01DRAFT_366609 [Linnemannia elongata]|nr:hypothetical protein F5H01DRAFT_366609 [Linnemannia elongata]
MFDVVLLLFKDPPNASELVKEVSVSDLEDINDGAAEDDGAAKEDGAGDNDYNSCYSTICEQIAHRLSVIQ